MSLENLNEDQINQMKERLLDVLRDWGGSAGNVSLIRKLGWPDFQYWSLRDSLVDEGSLQLGRGRGGSVRLLDQDETEEPQADTAAEIQEYPERDLYEPMSRVIRELWVKDQRFGHFLVETTACQGRRDTGGTWTRPDIVVASLTTLPYVPGKHFDVATFEVKPWAGLDVTAVYEALAHHRAATRSYVLAHVAEDRQEGDTAQRLLTRIDEEAKRHGIGFIVATRADDYDTWEERVEAVHREPAPHALNDFLSRQFTDGAKQEITTWFR